ncbi:MAG: type II toxin-antitoxin system VapC family toxin [Xanthomonadaceae bacterium]|nr:type II toxin-antitoxin system VapC family toxin [Xanthomonadaceae bacterium]MDE1885237.1 type II toxin-antitoxin system VapC family toxin [Xanthomonadaceae bacterium]MDE2084731.1 type II toxin-antitoxin system VapC family toxin [Xanthomonadaceae bacterium]
MNRVVFDASAVLALLNRETGWQTAEAALGDGCISCVNVCEVLARLIERGVPEKTAWEILQALELESVPFDDAHAREAARLRPGTRKQGLSLGDRACLALARTLKRPALTADRAWSSLDAGVDVRLLR